MQDYQPISLLNVDYKIYAHILANRLPTLVEDVLRQGQYCCTHTHNILDAANGIRDVLATAEIMFETICMVTLYFTSAFGRISHEYINYILGQYGLDIHVRHLIMSLYNNTTSR